MSGDARFCPYCGSETTYLKSGLFKPYNEELDILDSDDEAVFDLDGNKLEGKLPTKKERMVQTWIDIHNEDPQANRKLLQSGEQYFRIPPLQ